MHYAFFVTPCPVFVPVTTSGACGRTSKPSPPLSELAQIVAEPRSHAAVDFIRSPCAVIKVFQVRDRRDDVERAHLVEISIMRRFGGSPSCNDLADSSKRRRMAMMAISDVPKCSFQRSQIVPILSTVARSAFASYRTGSRPSASGQLRSFEDAWQKVRLGSILVISGANQALVAVGR
jgi:hypothetical protein